VVKRISAFLFFSLLVARPAAAQLALTNVQTIIAQAVTRATTLAAPLKTNAVIAITDREGWVLGVWAVDTNLPRHDFVLTTQLTLVKLDDSFTNGNL
jgi:hypothetical protein